MEMTMIYRRRLWMRTVTRRGRAFIVLLAQLGFVLALICPPAGAYQQTTVPDTAAGRVFSAWLKSFNSADAATITAFNSNHRRQPRALGQTLNLREQTGGFTPLRRCKNRTPVLKLMLQ